MRACDIVIGESYRFKGHPDYSWAKILSIHKPHTAWNKNGFIVVKCEHTINKGDTVGFVRYAKPSDLIKN
jgi:hypothetical protein